MNDIVCPGCGKAFKIDGSGYAEIVKQVRDKEFKEAISEKLHSLEAEKKSAVELETILLLEFVCLVAVKYDQLNLFQRMDRRLIHLLL